MTYFLDKHALGRTLPFPGKLRTLRRRRPLLTALLLLFAAATLFTPPLQAAPPGDDPPAELEPVTLQHEWYRPFQLASYSTVPGPAKLGYSPDGFNHEPDSALDHTWIYWLSGIGGGLLLLVAIALLTVANFNRRLNATVAARTGELEASNAELAQEIEAHRRTENALRESEATLNHAQKLAQLGSFVWQVDGDGLVWSQNMLAIAGLAPQDFAGNLGQVSAELMHPDDRTRVAEEIAAMMERKETWPMEFRIVRPDGQVRWLRSSSEFILDAAGAPISCVGVHYDMTENRQIEQALAESERFNQAVLGTIPTYLYLSDLTKKQNIWVNVSFGSLLNELGIKYDAPGGIDTVVHPDDLAGVHARLNSLEQLPDGAWVSVEFRFKHPHGEWRWLLNRTTVFERDEDSTVRKILGSIIDITERKQLEQALSKSERFNRAVLSVIPVQLYIYDVHQQRNTWVNAAQREFLDEVGIDYNAPRELLPLFHPDDLPTVAKRLARLRDSQVGEWEGIEFRVRSEAGDWRWMYDRATVFERDENGDVTQILGSTIDIDERKQIEEQVRAALNEKEALLRELYHRTKNNMQVISAMLSLQAARLPDPAAQEAFRDMEQRIRAMALVHQKLYRSQNLSSIEMSSYVRELVDLLLTSYPVQPGQIQINLAVEKMTLLIDIAIPCGLILNELLSNALKHAFPAGRSGEITICCRCDNGRINLQVSDNGVGLPADFDIRFSDTLGLQTVLSIAEHQLGGHLHYSGRPGAQFTVEFVNKPGKETL